MLPKSQTNIFWIPGPVKGLARPPSTRSANATATFQIAVRDSGMISLSWQVTPTASSVVGIASGATETLPAETNLRP